MSRGTALGALVVAGLPSYAWSRAETPPRCETPLPAPEAISLAYQQTVDFGPRLPGHPNHLRFVDWMGSEFEAAGLRPAPCAAYPYRRWDPLAFGLEVLDGDKARSVHKTAFYVRSEPTGPEGVTWPLFYGGKLTAAGPADLGDAPPGAIVVFEAELP